MWWSLISTWLRLRRTVPGYSITGQYILSLTDKFAAFSKAYVTSKIASYSRGMQCLLRMTKSADGANLQDEMICSTSRRVFSYKMNRSTSRRLFSYKMNLCLLI